MKVSQQILVKIVCGLNVLLRIRDKTSKFIPKCILINFGRGLGDFILFTSVLKSIKNYFNESQIIATVPPNLYDVIRESNYFNRIILVKTSEETRLDFFLRFTELLKLLKTLHTERIDILINPISCFTITTALITFFSKAKIKVGFGWWNSCRLYTHCIKVNKFEHDIIQNLKILSALGISRFNRKPEFPLSTYAMDEAKSFLKANKINDSAILIALHPITRGMEDYNPRNWEKDKFIEVGKQLFDKYKAQIIILGSERDKSVVEEIRLRIGQGAVSQAGKTSISAAAALLEKCGLLLTNDSGITHLGYAVDIPIVAIWGPTDPRRRGYVDEKRVVIKKKLPCQPCRDNPKMQNCKTLECLRQIGVKEVFDASCKLLDKRK